MSGRNKTHLSSPPAIAIHRPDRVLTTYTYNCMRTVPFWISFTVLVVWSLLFYFFCFFIFFTLRIGKPYPFVQHSVEVKHTESRKTTTRDNFTSIDIVLSSISLLTFASSSLYYRVINLVFLVSARVINN